MVHIKNLEVDDLPQFVDLWNQESSLLTSSNMILSISNAHEGFKLKMFDYVGLFHKKTLIGFLLFKDKSLFVIKHLCIMKNYRNRGCGSLLLNDVVKKAQQKNKKIQTEVLEENNIAKSFFVKNKFIIVNHDQAEHQFIMERE